MIVKKTTFIEIQYLVEPPRDRITTAILMGMLSTNPGMTASGSVFYIRIGEDM